MTNTTPTTLDQPVVTFTAETLVKAAELATAAYRPVWVGPSGEQSSGESVASHLEATIALLNSDGWVRTFTYTGAWPAGSGTSLTVDDSMSVKDMLKTLLQWVRDDIGTDPRRPLAIALRHVGEGDHGDADTTAIASTVLDLVIRAHTGSDTAHAAPWSERLARTHEEIVALLSAGAQFARSYGPA
ncbi:DUF6197 family protein [Streptomyces youssoufiensis]